MTPAVKTRPLISRSSRAQSSAAPIDGPAWRQRFETHDEARQHWNACQRKAKKKFFSLLRDANLDAGCLGLELSEIEEAPRVQLNSTLTLQQATSIFARAHAAQGYFIDLLHTPPTA